MRLQREAAAAASAVRTLPDANGSGDGETVLPSKPLTYADKLKALEERHRAEMAEEKRRLAREHCRDCETGLAAYIDQSEDDQLKTLWRDWRKAQKDSQNDGGAGAQRDLFGGSGERQSRRGKRSLAAMSDADRAALVDEAAKAADAGKVSPRDFAAAQGLSREEAETILNELVERGGYMKKAVGRGSQYVKNWTANS